MVSRRNTSVKIFFDQSRIGRLTVSSPLPSTAYLGRLRQLYPPYLPKPTFLPLRPTVSASGSQDHRPPNRVKLVVT